LCNNYINKDQCEEDANFYLQIALGLFTAHIIFPQILVAFSRLFDDYVKSFFKLTKLNHYDYMEEREEIYDIVNDFSTKLLYQQNFLAKLDPRRVIVITDDNMREIRRYNLLDFAKAVGAKEIIAISNYIAKIKQEMPILLENIIMTRIDDDFQFNIKHAMVLGAHKKIINDTEYLTLPPELIGKITGFIEGEPIPGIKRPDLNSNLTKSFALLWKDVLKDIDKQLASKLPINRWPSSEQAIKLLNSLDSKSINDVEKGGFDLEAQQYTFKII
jgi:hypothetical protein